jgi:branched-chain amino acid aminotransferase
MTDAKSFPFAFFEGRIVPTELARINIMNNALQYGNAVFGGIRGYISSVGKKINIFRISDHYQRFLRSLRIINKSIRYSESQLVEITKDLAQKNRSKTDCYFRPFAYAVDHYISPDLAPLNFDFALYMLPLGEYLSVSKGLKLAISNWVRITDNMIPARAKISGGYINSSLAKGDAVKLGFDDALMLSSDGHVAEGSGANFFMVREGMLITSPKYADVLEGITRNTILQLAFDLKIPVVEREIDRTEVYIADEAFLSGTGAQVAWVAEVDGRMIGDGKIGPISAKIQKLFFNIVRGKEKKYSSWLTKV